MTDPLRTPAGYRVVEVPGEYLTIHDPDGDGMARVPEVWYVHADCGSLVPDLDAVRVHNDWHAKLIQRILLAAQGGF